ncbi:hypothetical protein KCP73_04710 [Salmonella enterica subsp. enterica]|nr:hypothetical protein KCP73_04710 [Salmonella enterica subsp. enterica]
MKLICTTARPESEQRLRVPALSGTTRKMLARLFQSKFALFTREVTVRHYHWQLTAIAVQQEDHARLLLDFHHPRDRAPATPPAQTDVTAKYAASPTASYAIARFRRSNADQLQSAKENIITASDRSKPCQPAAKKTAGTPYAINAGMCSGRRRRTKRR